MDLNTQLKEKYRGFVRTIDLKYVDYDFDPETQKEIKNTYFLTWRPWKLKSTSADKQVWTSTEKHEMVISKEAMDKDGIAVCYPAIDKTIAAITITPIIARTFEHIQSSTIIFPLKLIASIKEASSVPANDAPESPCPYSIDATVQVPEGEVKSDIAIPDSSSSKSRRRKK